MFNSHHVKNFMNGLWLVSVGDFILILNVKYMHYQRSVHRKTIRFVTLYINEPLVLNLNVLLQDTRHSKLHPKIFINKTNVWQHNKHGCKTNIYNLRSTNATHSSIRCNEKKSAKGYLYRKLVLKVVDWQCYLWFWKNDTCDSNLD